MAHSAATCFSPTSDLLDVDSSTASAFLIAYLRALQDLSAEDAAAFASFDGGFGAAQDAGGLGEMESYLQDQLGEVPDLGALIDPTALEFAQAWWGLPANPTTVDAPTVDPVPDADTTDTAEEAA